MDDCKEKMFEHKISEAAKEEIKESILGYAQEYIEGEKEERHERIAHSLERIADCLEDLMEKVETSRIEEESGVDEPDRSKKDI